jgi:hypothetical protein
VKIAGDHVDRVAEKGDTWLRVTLKKLITKILIIFYPLQAASQRPLVVVESPDVTVSSSDEEHRSGW